MIFFILYLIFLKGFARWFRYILYIRISFFIKGEIMDNKDYVVCEICNKKMGSINYLHLRTHNITT